MPVSSSPSVDPRPPQRLACHALGVLVLAFVFGDATHAAPPSQSAAATLPRPGGYSGGGVLATVECDGRTVHWERRCFQRGSDVGNQEVTTFVLHPSGDGLDVEGYVPVEGVADPCGAPHLAGRWHAMHLPEGDYLVSEAELVDLVNLANAGESINDVSSIALRRISGQNLDPRPDPRAMVPTTWRKFVLARPLTVRVVTMGQRQAVRHGWESMPPPPPNFHETVSWRATLHLDRGRADGVFPGMVLYVPGATSVFATTPLEPRQQVESGLSTIVLVERVNEHDSEASIGWNLGPEVKVGSKLLSKPSR